MSGSAERTLIIVKPDGVARSLVGTIINRFERRGYKLVAIKMMIASDELLREHYADLEGKRFLDDIIQFFSAGPVVPMVWEGKDVVKQARTMLGDTNPLKSNPGTIRGDYSIDIGRNIIHGSDKVSIAETEIRLWFKDNELTSWSLPTAAVIYE